MRQLAAGFCALTLSVSFFSSAATSAELAVALGQDAAFGSPQLAADGERAVLERRVHGPGLLGQVLLRSKDVWVMDLGAACSADLLRPLTRDGASFDPTLTEDGQRVAYFHAASPVIEVVTEDFDGGNRLVVWPESTSSAHGLHLTPDGAKAVYLIETASGPQELVMLDLVGMPTRTVLDSGTLAVSAERPLADEFAVFWTREVNGTPEIYKWTPSFGVQHVATDSTSKGPPSVAPGQLLALTRTGGSGVMNVWAMGGGPDRQLTANADPNVDISEVTLDQAGDWVYFWSTGDHLGSNSEGNRELFRYRFDGTASQQLTDRLAPAAPPFLQYLGGRISPSHSTDLLTVLSGGSKTRSQPVSTVAGRNSSQVLLLSPESATATPIAYDRALILATPPFELRMDSTPLGVDPSCVAFDETMTCFLPALVSPEAPRELALLRSWSVTAPAGCELSLSLPLQLVSAGAGTTFTAFDTLTLPAGCDASVVDGVFEARLVGPAVGQPDLASASMSF